MPRPACRVIPALAVLSLVIAACTPAVAPAPPAPSAEFRAPAGGPPLIATGPDGAAELAAAAARVGAPDPSDRRRLRPVAAAMLPLIADAPEGQRFRAISGPRALIAGIPAAQCPALVAEGGADRQGAIARAVAGCFAALTAAGAPPDCGCQLLAEGDLLLAPADAFAYAKGVPARVISAGRLLPERYVASADGDTLTLYAATRPVWRVAAGTLQRLDPPGPALAATRRPIGLDRGWIRARIDALDPEGRPVSVLIDP